MTCGLRGWGWSPDIRELRQQTQQGEPQLLKVMAFEEARLSLSVSLCPHFVEDE